MRRVLGVVAILGVAVALTVGPFAGPASAATFTDVGAGDWFNPAVSTLSDAGVVSGFGDGTFRPYDPVTRAQFASMLARALQPPQVLVEPFEDVYSTDWFFGSVASLYQAGLISGTSATTFAPERSVDRQQTASLLLRSLAYKLQSQPQEGIDLSLPASDVDAWLGGFHDRELIADAHREAVANAYRLGIISGSGDGWFNPLFALTRAQAADMLYTALYQPLQPRTSYPAVVPLMQAFPDMSRGDSGTYVKLLETRLAELKYDTGQIDGVYDEATRDAVMAFQKVEGLTRDGAVGSEVSRRLSTARTPSPRYSAGGDRVEIDKTRQVLFLIKSGSVVRILPVSTGRSGWPTPTGHYRIERKLSYWRESALGLLYMPSYFYEGYAIHGSPSVPAYAASHGCVRVPIWATPSLYDQLRIGMAVDLYF